MDRQHGRPRAAKTLSADTADQRSHAIALVADLAGRKREDINPGQRLEADLGISGVDAEALMRQLSLRFDVDLAGFHFLRHFAAEDFDLLAPAIVSVAGLICPTLRRKWMAALDAEREITVSHLLRIVEARRWIEPGETARRKRGFSGARLLFSLAAILLLFAMPLFFVAAAAYAPAPRSRLEYIAGAGFFLAVLAYMALASWRGIRRKLASVA